MIKKTVKTLLKIVAPQRFAAISSERANRHGQRFMEKQGIPVISERFLEKYGATVQSGPFAQMAYLDHAIGSSFIPKLTGSYESELHGVVRLILNKSYDVVVDVGSAEGYYAVGLALCLPAKPLIYAFDVDNAAQKMCHELSMKNGVQDQVLVSGYCDTKRLEATLHGRSLVICDCEGFEMELLNPVAVPSLATSEIIVELHENENHTLTKTLTERFSPSHYIELIDSAPRDPADYPILHFLDSEQQRVALSEFRHGPQQWAHMSPKSTRD